MCRAHPRYDETAYALARMYEKVRLPAGPRDGFPPHRGAGGRNQAGSLYAELRAIDAREAASIQERIESEKY